MGPWRATADDAKEDAVDASFASRDEFSSTVYLDVPAEIWLTFDQVEIAPRVALAPAPGPYPLRIDRIISRRRAASG